MTRTRSAAVVIFGLAVLGAGLWAFEGWRSGELGGGLEGWPIESVRVAGDFRRMPRESLERAIAPQLGVGFFRVDLDRVREAALALPWVKRASVRRVWPDSLHVAVIERRAVARWSRGGLIDAQGGHFTPDTRPPDIHPDVSDLPLFEGPAGSHAAMLEGYRAFSEALAPAGTVIRKVTLDARGAWRLELGDGVAVVLGREPSVNRLEQLGRLLDGALAGRRERIERVDLRYANGFAVRWRESPEQRSKRESILEQNAEG